MEMIEVYNIILMIPGTVFFILIILAVVIIRNYRKTNRQNKVLKKELNQQSEKGKVISLFKYDFPKNKRKNL